MMMMLMLMMRKIVRIHCHTEADLTNSSAQFWTSTPKLFPSSFLGSSNVSHSSTLSVSSTRVSRWGRTVSIIDSTWARSDELTLLVTCLRDVLLLSSSSFRLKASLTVDTHCSSFSSLTSSPLWLVRRQAPAGVTGELILATLPADDATFSSLSSLFSLCCRIPGSAADAAARCCDVTVKISLDKMQLSLNKQNAHKYDDYVDNDECTIDQELADSASAFTRWQHFSVWNDIIAAVLKVWRHIINRTPSIDAF